MGHTGLLQVYTGNGKGKTTAALGLALRALGHGWKVNIIQFMKGDKYGEIHSLQYFPTCKVKQYGRDVLVDIKNPDAIDIELAHQGFLEALNAIKNNTCDLLILDELNVAIAAKLLSEDDVIAMLKQRPDTMEIIVTGRYAVPQMIALADLVTEMQAVKHPFEKGIEARVGIEF